MVDKLDETFLKNLDETFLKNLKRFNNSDVKQAYKKFLIQKNVPCVTDYTLYKWATGRSRPTEVNKGLVREFFEEMSN